MHALGILFAGAILLVMLAAVALLSALIHLLPWLALAAVIIALYRARQHHYYGRPNYDRRRF